MSSEATKEVGRTDEEEILVDAEAYLLLRNGVESAFANHFLLPIAAMRAKAEESLALSRSGEVLGTSVKTEHVDYIAQPLIEYLRENVV